MRIAIGVLAIVMLAGCTTSEYKMRRTLAVKSLSTRWIACVDSAAWQWLDDSRESVSDEVKRLRGTLTYGQMLIRSLDQCREHLATSEIERWDSLDNAELSRFIRQAQRRFQLVAAEIQRQHDLESI